MCCQQLDQQAYINIMICAHKTSAFSAEFEVHVHTKVH